MLKCAPQEMQIEDSSEMLKASFYVKDTFFRPDCYFPANLSFQYKVWVSGCFNNGLGVSWGAVKLHSLRQRFDCELHLLYSFHIGDGVTGYANRFKNGFTKRPSQQYLFWCVKYAQPPCFTATWSLAVKNMQLAVPFLAKLQFYFSERSSWLQTFFFYLCQKHCQIKSPSSLCLGLLGKEIKPNTTEAIVRL